MKIFLYCPGQKGLGKYNGELIHMLANTSMDARLLIAPPYYSEWKHRYGP